MNTEGRVQMGGLRNQHISFTEIYTALLQLARTEREDNSASGDAGHAKQSMSTVCSRPCREGLSCC